MNFGELIAAAQTRSGVGYDATAAGDVVNEALQAISSEERWPWLQGVAWQFTASSAGPFTPPFGWSDIRSVVVNDTLYPQVHIEEIDDTHAAFGWTVQGDRLVISPDLGAGETVVVRLDRIEDDLTLAADEPALPPQWHHAVVNLAAAIICERVDDTRRAAALRGDYQSWLHRMRRHKRRGLGPIAPRVRPGAAI